MKAYANPDLGIRHGRELVDGVLHLDRGARGGTGVGKSRHHFVTDRLDYATADDRRLVLENGDAFVDCGVRNRVPGAFVEAGASAHVHKQHRSLGSFTHLRIMAKLRRSRHSAPRWGSGPSEIVSWSALSSFWGAARLPLPRSLPEPKPRCRRWCDSSAG